MKIKLLLIFCLFSFGANAYMPQAKMRPPTKEEVAQNNIKIFNTEVSRNLIHLAHANWSDEAVEGHSTPEFFKKYTSGQFLEYVPYGQLMSFEGVYDVEYKQEDSSVLARAKAAFELKKVDVEITYKGMDGRYLIDEITITPIEPNDQMLNQVMC